MLAEKFGTTGIPPELARDIRPVASQLVVTICDEVLREVAAYAGSSNGARRRIVQTAVAAAVGLFLDVVEGEPTAPADVVALFVDMGRREALAGHSLDAMRAALDLATHRAADALREPPGRVVPDGACALLRSALLTYMQMLMDDVRCGHADGTIERETDVRWVRLRTAQLILAQAPADHVAALAARACWPMPDTVVVCSTDPVRGEQLTPLPLEALRTTRGRRVVVLAPATCEAEVSARMRDWPRSGPVAVTAPVPLGDVPAAVRWADRALRLVSEGIIPTAPVVRCADHHVALLLHADPTLSRWEAGEVLAPLARCKGEYRRALCRTLRLWLQTGEDARRLALRLDLHEHTVRNHKQKLTELFGQRLKDPDFATLLLFALGAENDVSIAG